MQHLLGLVVATVLAIGGFGQEVPGPPDVGTDAERAARAAATAEELFGLAAAGGFNALYDRIHPDAHAVIPRVVAVRSFEEIYGQTQAGQAEIIGAQLGEWTWQVTGQTYPEAAQVSFTQPYVDAAGQERINESQMYLVPFEGEWRWFFGNSRAFIAEAIGRFAPPAPQEAPGDTLALLEGVTRDLDTFYRDALASSEYQYASPRVVVVDEGEFAQTGCGPAQPGFWAFYCPVDQSVYLDLPFLRDIEQRYGDFAAAFVVGHEWAHHIETTIGGLERVGAGEAPDQINEVYTIQLELMADCFTGVWARDAETRGLFDFRDVAEGIAFAARLAWPGCQVTIAASGEEALRCFAEHGADLVILDVSMPPPDGFEVCRRIRAGSPVPILMLTARDDTLDKVRALDLGADDYLTKPFDPLELLACGRCCGAGGAWPTRPLLRWWSATSGSTRPRARRACGARRSG